MKKILIYLSSDGWKNTITLIIKSIIKRLYYQTTTNFYIWEKKNEMFENHQVINNLSIKEIRLDEIESLDFPRLKLLTYKKWMNDGGHVYVSFLNEKPVGFAWTHLNSYHIHGVGTFKLYKNEYWSGPTFVLNSLRGLGINKAQLAFQFNHLPNNSIVFTSINENNAPSIRSYAKYGYKLIGFHKINILFGKRKHQIEGDIIKERLLLS